MNNTILIDENTRLSRGIIKEGGYSRNYALMNWLKRNCSDLRILILSDNKIHRYIQVLFTLMKRKGKTIIFQYPTIGVPLFSNNIIKQWIVRIFFYLIRNPVLGSRVIMDVSDLKYEQSIDLEVNRELRNLEVDEARLFGLDNVLFIFASYSMRKYACDKYSIPYENTDVCINGGEPLIKRDIDISMINKEKINFIYAGTLNKGRQIESLIKVFPDSSNIHLYLMGSNGDWIITKQKNITYLGSYEELDAHFFASNCDVGLIPYDNDRLYYNIAYPTKLSFYITAGIPYLSTPVIEVERENKKINGGWLLPITEWGKIFLGTSKDDIKLKKKNIAKNMTNYMWDTIFDNNKFIR